MKKILWKNIVLAVDLMMLKSLFNFLCLLLNYIKHQFRFYISCNVCNRWYHGKCVSVTEKKAQKLLEDNAKTNGKSGWVCSDCEKARTQFSTEVYCVCRRPYDDTKYVICYKKHLKINFLLFF